MEDLVSTSAGLNSLSGFSFQIKVFILMMTQLKERQRVEFETLDDVVVKNFSLNEKADDSCIKTHTVDDGKIVAFQVKQTRVTDSIARKVLYNWLIALSKKRFIQGFELILDEGYTCTSRIFSNAAENEFKIITESNMSDNALITRVKNIYNDRIEDFAKDYNYICSRVTIKNLNDINGQIVEKLCVPFHSAMTDSVKPHFSLRIRELCQRVCGRIMESAEKRIPFVCEYGEYMQMCEEICRDISEEQYRPD